jgi:mRNA cleavage and polyadenylation factor CLP1 P-loop
MKSKWFPLAPPSIASGSKKTNKPAQSAAPINPSTQTNSSSNTTTATTPMRQPVLIPSTASHEKSNSNFKATVTAPEADSTSIVSPTFKILRLDPSHSLLLLPHQIPNSSLSPTFYIGGHGRVTLLKGQAQLYGYSLSKGIQVTVNNVPWNASYPLSCTHKSSSSSKSGSTSSYISLLKTHLPNDVFKQHMTTLTTASTEADTILLIESVPHDLMEWMLQLERIEQIFVVSQTLSQVNSPEVGAVSPPLQYINLSSLLIHSNINRASSLGAESLLIHPSWSSAVNTVMTLPAVNSPRVLFCGAKGSGKSSCLRYTLNRLLSRHKQVAVLDCDVGQPEYSIPGMVSLSL